MKTKIGVLGTANIARRSILPALLSLGDLYEVVGIASRNINKANLFANQFDIPAFEGYQSIIDSDIDAIYIPLPNGLHYEWVNKSLERGLHVLVEKSLACSMSEVIYLNNLAKEKDLVLLENFQFRFHRQFSRILELVFEEKQIGELRNVRSSFGFPPFSDSENIRYSKDLGGGSLYDAGAYPLKISQLLLGLNLVVDGAFFKIDSDKKIDLYGSIQLVNQENTVSSQVAFGFDNAYQCGLELWGSNGRLTVDRVYTCPPSLSTKILIENEEGSKSINIEPDNHFVNMLIYFHSLINDHGTCLSEYIYNIDQARLLEDSIRICRKGAG